MPHAYDPTLLQKALAVLDVDKRLKANAAKLRYENRQQRLHFLLMIVIKNTNETFRPY